MGLTRIMAVASGAPEDASTLAAAAALARPLKADLAVVFAPADAADLLPLMGEGFMSGVQVSALESLNEAAAIGETQARRYAKEAAYGPMTFKALTSPIRDGLAMEARFSDLVVVPAEAAVGRGPLADAFELLLLEERAAVLAARSGLSKELERAVVAWDGGREATRAARLAIPWLRGCGHVLILSAPEATGRVFEPERLAALFAEEGVKAEVEVLPGGTDPGEAILKAANAAGADLLVAGAYGHPRFQEVVFGGTTRQLIHAEDGPSLFLAH